MALAKLYSNTETIIVLCQYVFEIVTMLLGVPPLWWVELAPKIVFGKKIRLDMIGKRFANFCWLVRFQAKLQESWLKFREVYAF